MSHILLLIIAILIVVVIILIPGESENQKSCDILDAKLQVLNQTNTLDQVLINGIYNDLGVLCPDGFGDKN